MGSQRKGFLPCTSVRLCFYNRLHTICNIQDFLTYRKASVKERNINHSIKNHFDSMVFVLTDSINGLSFLLSNGCVANIFICKRSLASVISTLLRTEKEQKRNHRTKMNKRYYTVNNKVFGPTKYLAERYNKGCGFLVFSTTKFMDFSSLLQQSSLGFYKDFSSLLQQSSLGFYKDLRTLLQQSSFVFYTEGATCI